MKRCVLQSSLPLPCPLNLRNAKPFSQLKSIENKGVRHFYEEQNEALSDWLEVDSVVRSIADDILESFDPDRDHDGLLERGGALQAQNEDVEAFLPQEEREKRSKGERDAKRAINVCQIHHPRIHSPFSTMKVCSTHCVNVY